MNITQQMRLLMLQNVTSTAGTKITVNTLSGQIPTDIAVSKLADYLTFTGVEGSDLSAIKNSSKEYTLIVKMLMVQTLNSLKTEVHILLQYVQKTVKTAQVSRHSLLLLLQLH